MDSRKSATQSVAVKQEVTPDGVIAQLQISSAEATDNGAYFCQASNVYGRDQQLVQLLVQGTGFVGQFPPVAVAAQYRIIEFQMRDTCALRFLHREI